MSFAPQGGRPDPYTASLLKETLAVGGNPLSGRNYVVDAKTQVSPRLVPGQRTLVILGLVSQSNQACHLQGTYVAGSNVHNFSIDNGACYRAADPMVGCTFTSASYPGNYLSRLGDKMIAGGNFDRVIVAPVGLGGTSVRDWAPGGVCNHLIPATLSRARDAGYFAADALAVLSHIGETDNALGTSGAVYQAAAAGAYNSILDFPGFNGKLFAAQCSFSAGVTSATVRNAQAATINGTTILALGDADTIGAGGRYDNTHFNATGADAWATICAASLTANL